MYRLCRMRSLYLMRGMYRIRSLYLVRGFYALHRSYERPAMSPNHGGFCMFSFSATPVRVAGRTIIRLPQDVSLALPARSMALGEVTLARQTFLSQLEPDGKGGHWLEVEEGAAPAGQPVAVGITLPDTWPEPDMPGAFLAELASAGLNAFWQDVTPKAKWEWFRWLRDTKSEATRAKRVHVAVDKLRKGMRRPCCFNTAACTVPEVSKGGVLMEG